MNPWQIDMIFVWMISMVHEFMGFVIVVATKKLSIQTLQSTNKFVLGYTQSQTTILDASYPTIYGESLQVLWPEPFSHPKHYRLVQPENSIEDHGIFLFWFP